MSSQILIKDKQFKIIANANVTPLNNWASKVDKQLKGWKLPKWKKKNKKTKKHNNCLTKQNIENRLKCLLW